ncbi:acylphosphatase [Candidatus Stoquefichus massiliensis]|uniref:acylphosphatase n=1 Tax=Candidatus Stoquefichus massiliensis TaxID=1470350 RepID=UPI00048834B5|nr:acylphosphatase [Candidatus Stoquefichus massiliensis]
MLRRHYIFYGRVQGVGFRYTVYQLARHLGLTGWVRNQSDGTVEACIQGNLQQINQLIASLKQERFIRVERFEYEELEVLSNENSFEVKY